MTFTLDKVVPWGRSYDEYISMFSLSTDDLRKRILGCGDGPASFNAELTKRGGNVVSIDPIYKFPARDILERIEETYDVVIEQTKNNMNEFAWKSIKSVDELGSIRMKSMMSFLDDYKINSGNYVAGGLPDLGFDDNEFDLALCSHFLFLYSHHYDCAFHFSSILEMLRVAREVRIFPILELGAKKSRHLVGVIGGLRALGVKSYIARVDYEFQIGGNEMMCVYR